VTALDERPVTVAPGRDGFAQLLHAEWTKLRSVRGWVIGVSLSAVLLVLFGMLSASGSTSSCGERTCDTTVPEGPSGIAVVDSFYFAHQTLDGDGSITVRVASLTGEMPDGLRGPSSEPGGPGDPGRPGDPGGPGTRPGLQQWSKAGIIVKDGTTPGSRYAAVMLTGTHGVRMQYDYTHDIAGPADARWLRLTRTGDQVTGYASGDGASWTRIGTVRLRGLPVTAQAGLFATSPAFSETVFRQLGSSASVGGPTSATATFDQVRRDGRWSADGWRGEQLGGDSTAYPTTNGGLREAGGTVTVTGSGDIAPAVPWAGSGGMPVESTLTGATAALLAVLVVGALFITTEYRRGLIRTTLLASPRRGRVLAAKAVVIGSATFVVTFLASALAAAICWRILRSNGNTMLPAPLRTDLQVYAGTALLLALAAVLALALGALLRRGAGAVALVITVIVLPYILATANVLPLGPSQWLLRLSPAAGYAMQQSIPHYGHIAADATAAEGYFPLPVWAGFAVLAGYAALALGLATLRLRRRDA
jgi:ABC-type transport system involved in multi-copper enzyme maturation permease subunit